jgi:hypothetical protein
VAKKKPNGTSKKVKPLQSGAATEPPDPPWLQWVKANPFFRSAKAMIAGAAAIIALITAFLVLWDRWTAPSDPEIAAGDAAQFGTSLKLVWDPCGSQRGAVGWGNFERPAADGVIPAFDNLETDLAFAEYSTVRLGFRLPKTADTTTIEVTDITIEADPGPAEPPAWAVYSEGCGGSEYSARFRVAIRDGSATTERVNQMGEPVGDRQFHPFMVEAGEFVHHNYTVAACDRATYDVRFRIEYRSDQGVEETTYIPEDGVLTISSVPPRASYVPGTFEALAPAPKRFGTWPPKPCPA